MPRARRRSSSGCSPSGATSSRSRPRASSRRMEDLERREELLRDMRASVERMLRARDDRSDGARGRGRGAQPRGRRAPCPPGRGGGRARAAPRRARRRRAQARGDRAAGAGNRRTRGAARARQAAQVTRRSRRGPPAAPANDLEGEQPVALLFVPGPAYTLVEVEPRALRRGAEIEHEGKSVRRDTPRPGAAPGRREDVRLSRAGRARAVGAGRELVDRRALALPRRRCDLLEASLGL